MQLARMRYLQNEPRNITYKIRQMLLALKLETRMSKGEILDEYLHRVYLGSGTFGFAAAAQRYFATPVSLLTDAQQTLLIALLPSPEASNPLTHPDHAKNQRDLVLEKLADKDIIDPSRLDELRSAPLTLNPSPESVVTAPHFALRMYDKVTDMGLT